MKWKSMLNAMIEYAFDLIPESQHEQFVNAMIKIVFEYCGGFKE